LNNKAMTVGFASQIVYRHLAKISHSSPSKTTLFGLKW
jgi:hypothetical protein